MTLPTLPAIISQFRAASTLQRVQVEHVTSVKLSQVSQDDLLTMYEGSGAIENGLELELDYREPKPKAAVNGGPLLNISIRGTCIHKSTIEKEYGPMKVIGVPTGRSLDEELSLSRKENWGDLSFGFAERRPNCLSTVTFDYKR